MNMRVRNDLFGPEAGCDWYLVMTKPNEDLRAETNLRLQNFETFRPLLKYSCVRNGRRQVVVESLFPRYIFIKLGKDFGNWNRLMTTRGIASLVRFNDSPAIVPWHVINSLKAQVDDDNVLDTTVASRFGFLPGDIVELTACGFEGSQAIVKTQRSEERVAILLNLMGRQQTVDVPAKILRKPGGDRPSPGMRPPESMDA